MTLIVGIVTVLALFALAYVSRRRFGVLGLALTAGALLASQMTRDVSRAIDTYDIPIEPLTAVSAASIFLILLPALVLLLGGPSYKKRKQALWGATAFSLMAMLLILGPLTTSLSPDRIMGPILELVARYENGLLAIGIVVAVVDVWMIRSNAPPPDEKKKK